MHDLKKNYELYIRSCHCDFQFLFVSLYNAGKIITSTCFLYRKDVDVNMSNKAGLTALHLACQAGDTLLVCICQEEANSKELSSFNAETFPDKIILKVSMLCFTYHVSWMDGLAIGQSE